MRDDPHLLDEIVIQTRDDGSWAVRPLRVVVVGGQAYVRSAFGTRGRWFRRVCEDAAVRVETRDGIAPVRLEPVHDPDLDDGLPGVSHRVRTTLALVPPRRRPPHRDRPPPPDRHGNLVHHPDRRPADRATALEDGHHRKPRDLPTVRAVRHVSLPFPQAHVLPPFVERHHGLRTLFRRRAERVLEGLLPGAGAYRPRRRRTG
ncbi:DUF2255 family protein [Embleya sp. MST-111070]|uniref:DUF2255 family protein n=1 Tax=Embleya sp. MST-111070 TaxID=3398231 RepID=UPI003F73C3FB